VLRARDAAVRLRRRTGFRGAFLILLGTFDAFYGWYLVTMGSLEYPLLIPERTWGIIWLAIGVILAAGSQTIADRWFYTLATALKIAWAAEFFRIQYVHDGGQWTRGAYFLALGLIVVLVSSWPEPAWMRPR